MASKAKLVGNRSVLPDGFGNILMAYITGFLCSLS
jgi:hypothetical protein